MYTITHKKTKKCGPWFFEWRENRFKAKINWSILISTDFTWTELRWTKTNWLLRLIFDWHDESITPPLVHQPCVNLCVNRPILSTLTLLNIQQTAQDRGQEVSQKKEQEHCVVNTQTERERQREVEDSEPLFPVTPGQSRCTHPVIELH